MTPTLRRIATELGRDSVASFCVSRERSRWGQPIVALSAAYNAARLWQQRRAIHAALRVLRQGAGAPSCAICGWGDLDEADHAPTCELAAVLR